MTSLLSYALCEVDDVKENLGISSGDHTKDNLIRRKINQATEMIEGYTGRRFASTVYTDEVYDGTLRDELVLKNRPVTSVTLKARSTSLNESDFDTVDSEQYFIDSNAGIIKAVSSFYGGYDRWAVTYTAGYTTIPSDLQEACATLAAYLTDSVSSDTGGVVKRKAEGSRSIEYYDTSQNMTTSSIIDQLNLDETLNRYSNTVITGI